VKYQNILDIRLLLEVPGIEVNKQDNEGFTPLMIACGMFDRVEVVERLLAHPSIDVNVKSRVGVTALMIACNSYKRLNIVEMLVKHPAINVNTQNKEEDTALLIANRSPYKRKEMMQLLLTHPTIDVNVTDRNGSTALLAACEAEQLDIVALLLQNRGVDVNKVYGTKERTILMQMVENTKPALVKLFIDREDVNFSVKDRSNSTVLDFACSKNNLEVLKRGMDCMQSNTLSRRAEATRLLFKAVKKNCDLDLLKCLLAYNVNPNATDERRQRLLHVKQKSRSYQATL
jgi:ankyrin repeat protein